MIDIIYLKKTGLYTRFGKILFFLANEKLDLFLTSEIIALYDGSIASEDLILDIRRKKIIEAERKFVESLNIFYNEPLDF